MSTGLLGREYEDREIIIQQGDVGDCMYVIQEGRVEVFLEENGREIQLAVGEEGDFFGEMAIFDRELRSANIRALGPARVLTVDKKNLLQRIHADPALAFRLVETMSRRIRDLNDEVMRLTSRIQA